MEKEYVEDWRFENVNFEEQPPVKGEYENCDFINCNFSNTNLSGFRFAECRFNGCNLSLVKLTDTALQDAQFAHCKLLGVRFDACNSFLLKADFEHCILSLASFYRVKLTGGRFIQCTLHETDFTEAVLTGSVFDGSNLAGAIFDQCNLEKADFRTAVNYLINPASNRVKKAKFSLHGVAGLLQQFDIVID